MLKFISVVLIYFAFILFFSFIIIKLSQKSSCIYPDYSVLTVKNCEKTIENTIRNIAEQMRFDSNRFSELVIIDLGSDDTTPIILEHLSKEYPFIHPMNKDEYINHINTLSK